MELFWKTLTLTVIGQTLKDCTGHWVKIRHLKQCQQLGRLGEILEVMIIYSLNMDWC